MEADEESLALETILEEGAGGSFIATEYTAFNFRQALWMPQVWSKTMFNSWNTSGRKNEIDVAKNIYMSIINDGKSVESVITEDVKKELVKIINTYKKK